MSQYIDKAALVAEIKRIINGIDLDPIEDWRYILQWKHDIEVMKNILSLINTLEVKEVNLDEVLCEYFKGWRTNYYSETEELLKPNDCTVDIDDVKEIAKHFFELGFKAAQNNN